MNNKENESQLLFVSEFYISRMTTEELQKELVFIDRCNPSNKTQWSFIIDYASKIKSELNKRQ